MKTMREILNIQQQLVPDLTDVLKKRYTILRHIQLMGVAGRRSLAAALGLTERVLRSETDFLKAQGLVEIDSSGMRISPSGRELLDAMEPAARELFGLSEMEEALRKKFGLKSVTVVPGDSDSSPLAKKELGRAGAAVIRRVVRDNDIVAVAGGSTMAETAEWLSASFPVKNVTFVPARGGLNESVELQANTIVSTMAKRTNGLYQLLHVPDNLGEEAYQSLMQEPGIREVVASIRKARVIVHGIGDAERMARRRKMEPRAIEALKEAGAVAEAFGFYFDKSGRMVYRMPTIGLRLEDIERTETVIAIAGGRSKGEAIAAVMLFGHEDMLVTDEAAARVMLGL